MMSTKLNHKRWRRKFNEDCLDRDGYKCVFCDETEGLNVHHITDRHEMPNGGYHTTNGITVCEEHHLECEKYHMEEPCEDQYLPDSLYKKLGTTSEEAYQNCLNLK